MYVWDALSNIYQECIRNPQINTYVIIANDEHSGETISQKAYAAKLTEYLLELKIPYFKIPRNDPALLQKFFDDIQPDYIFRQYPWEDDYPTLFKLPNLKPYKLIYVPYFALDLMHFVINNHNMEVDSPFHRQCYRIYCNSPSMLEAGKEAERQRSDSGATAERQRSDSGATAEKFVYLGNTKLEHITLNHQPQHNFQRTGKLHILWCPHHSIEGTVNIATFTQNCMDFVRLAQQNPHSIHIRLRAHPFLFAKLDTMLPQLSAQFKQQWAALDNTSVDEHWDCLESFGWSDLQITDGVSFLAEYPIIGKPSIFIEKDGHMPFNENGRLAAACNHTARNMQDVVRYLQDYLNGRLPSKQNELERFKQRISYQGAAKRIVQDLLQHTPSEP
ncbi:hypothetical protein CGZ60_07330 [Neisseria animalis]|nr:hypothetical protein CGZ60_07330 [Neisseria animalis]